MAINQQFKITKLAKDLGMKSKDLVEILSQNGIEAKTTQKALEPAEFDVLFETLTKANQISDIGNYLDGVTYIPSKMKKEKVEKAEPAETAPKAETVTPPAKEEKPAPVKEAPKAEAPTKKEEAPQKEVTPKKEAAPKKEATPKKEAAPAKVAEAPKAAPAVKEAPKAEPTPKAEAPKATATTPPQGESAPATKKPAAPTAAPQAPARPQQARQPYVGNPYRPQQNGAGGTASVGTRPQQNGAGGMAPAGARPQQPFGGQGGRPQPGNNAYGNGQSGFAPRGGQAQGGFGGRPMGGNPNQGKGNGNGRPQPGGNGPRFDRDKGDYNQNAPREKFKAQPIVRGASTNVNPDGTLKGPRVVDTRTSTVDLSKYDERLDTFVSEDDRQLQGGGNQKLKKQNNNAQGGQGSRQVQNNKKGNKGRRGAAPAPVVSFKPTHVELPEEIVVGQLASKLKVTAGEVVKKLMLMGVMATVNQVVDYDTAALIADEFGVETSPEVVVSIEERLFDEAEDTAEQLTERAPVVCVMGHVDHGKTSILDAIRNTHVTAGEAGGITQHIGAYRVKAGGRDITFLDTPGHAAFTAMRARGAMATDIAILVVAADDGIMPQTVEAINHAKAAGIDIVVAINKMDKPTANPDAVKQELTKYGLVPEEWGGDAICVPVSALTHQGIDDLLESVLLVAEVKELKANPNRRAKGLVIEAKLDRGRGPVATVLVQNGTLHSGDIIIAGTAVGRVRSMTDHTGKPVKEAAPSVPVEITGLAEVPSAGDEFQAVEDERMARTLADQRRAQAKEDNFKANARANLNDLFAQISDGVKDLNIIVKADVDGSVEAVKASLLKLSNDEVKVRVIHAAAGGITEGDVTFAAASNAIIVGFNVRPDKTALDSAERQNVDVRTYRVIYECIEEIEAAMKGMLAP